MTATIPDIDWDDIESPGKPVSKLAASTVRWGEMATTMVDKLEAAGELNGALTGLPSGFADLDRLLNGFHKGKLYLVAALTGGGKSVLLGDFWRTWMEGDVASCMISLEMDRGEIWLRQAAAACRIPHHALRAGTLEDKDWSALARWIGQTENAPAWICDQTTASTVDLREYILDGVERYGWEAVIVDYAQKITMGGASREQAVAGIATSLKDIARTANIPLLVGAQLNREANKRPGGVPKLSDLRESAALEHEADAAILIHRPDYDDPQSPRAGEADLIVAKNRGGPRDTITVAAQLHLQRFVDMAI